MKINDDVIKSLISIPFLNGSRETTVPIKQIKKLQEEGKLTITTSMHIYQQLKGDN